MVIDTTTWATRWRRLAAWWNSLDEIVQANGTVGVVIGTTRERVPVYLPAPSPSRANHALILAASGAGKTVLTAQALLDEIALLWASQPPESRNSYVLVDPKGDLILHVLQGVAHKTPDRLSSLVYLNAFSECGFSFNLCTFDRGKTPVDVLAMQIAGLAAVASTGVGAQQHLGVGARQVDVLEHLLLGALASNHPAASVVWALDALTAPKGMALLASLTTSPRAKQFLLSAHLSDELRASSAARLRLAFAATDQLERLVSAPGCISFHEILGPGLLVVVDLGQPPGGLAALRGIWSNLLVRLVLDHLLQRPSPWPGHHVRVVIDEAQLLAPALADVAENVLCTGRSKGVSLTLLSQGTTMIRDADESLLRVLLTNVPTKLIGRLAAADAELLAREQSPALGVDETISQVRSRFAVTVSNLSDRAFYCLRPGQREKFTSKEVDIAAWERAAQDHAGEISALKARYGLPSTTPPRVTLSQAFQEMESKSKPAPKSKPASKSKASTPSASRSRWG